MSINSIQNSSYIKPLDLYIVIPYIFFSYITPLLDIFNINPLAYSEGPLTDYNYEDNDANPLAYSEGAVPFRRDPLSYYGQELPPIEHIDGTPPPLKC